MLRASDDLAKSYYLKTKFNEFMDSKDEKEAKKRLSNWILAAQVSNLEEFKKCTNTFIKWQREILNAFKYGYTNGFTEGCNNKIKVLKRISYGIKRFENLRTRILHLAS